jgi:hypothetical protein
MPGEYFKDYLGSLKGENEKKATKKPKSISEVLSVEIIIPMKKGGKKGGKKGYGK